MTIRNASNVSLFALAWATGCFGLSASAQAQTRDVGGSGNAVTSPVPTSSQDATLGSRTVPPATSPVGDANTTVGEVVVTAQKRSENIQNVGMSIQAASGQTLTKLGITDATQLSKIAPGFSYTYGFNGSPIFSIRGVGFADTALASAPAVSIYNDEVPLPFSILSSGSTLDLERVEILKGPQGTLFGENSTGGAVNYIAAKPADHFEAGADLSYGRFNTGDVQAFVSGPVTDTLDLRFAVRTRQGDGWQQSYTRDATLGEQNFTTARISALWKPTSHLRVLLTLSGFNDRSDTQAPQLEGILPLNNQSPVPAALTSYAHAPANDRAADWNQCISNSGTSNSCVGYAKNNGLYMGSARIDYDLGGDMTLTSLTSYQKFQQFYPFDGDGTTVTNYEALQTGFLDTTYQELRLAGKFAGRGNWIVGGNYEYDGSWQNILQNFSQSSSSTALGLPIDGSRIEGRQKAYTYAGFVHGDYPITSTITLNGGVRYTQVNKSFTGGQLDNGNDFSSLVSQIVQNISAGNFTNLLGPPGINAGPGGATTILANGQPGFVHENLNQNNVSWRGGAEWKVIPSTLLYANLSRGYKAGSFEPLAATVASQLTPAKQESLLATEVGFKSSLFNRTLQLDGAAYYYDYFNKQINGSVPDPLLGDLPRLINIPHSNVEGFELSGIWRPIEGLTVTPVVSYAHSNIDGNFSTYNSQAQLVNISGQRFPVVPEWQTNLDAEYDWPLRQDITAFVGGNASYQSRIYDDVSYNPNLKVPSYALLDLRAGIQKDSWRLQLWGRNVTDTYYSYFKVHVVDVYARYAGMPATYGFTLSYRYR